MAPKKPELSAGLKGSSVITKTLTPGELRRLPKAEVEIVGPVGEVVRDGSELMRWRMVNVASEATQREHAMSQLVIHSYILTICSDVGCASGSEVTPR